MLNDISRLQTLFSEQLPWRSTSSIISFSEAAQTRLSLTDDIEPDILDKLDLLTSKSLVELAQAVGPSVGIEATA